MKQVIIDRSKWRTGCEGPNATGLGKETMLKNKEGFMCCLGFISKSYKKRICDIETPGAANCYIPNLTTREFDGEFWANTELSACAYRINDDIDTSRSEKEKLLKELFKGILDLKFVGRSVKYGKFNF